MSEAKTKSVGTKVAPALYDMLSMVAIAQRRTVADMVREMIEQGLVRITEGKALGGSSEAAERLLELEKKVEAATRAAAEARYYAALAATYGMDVAHYVAQKVEIGVVPKAPDKEAKKRQAAMFEKKAREFAQGWGKGEMEGK